MRAQLSTQARKLAEEIRSLPSRPHSPANALFLESIQCKQTLLAAMSIVDALNATFRAYRNSDLYEALPILPDVQPPLI